MLEEENPIFFTLTRRLIFIDADLLFTQTLWNLKVVV